MSEKYDDDGNLVDDEGNVIKTKEDLEKEGEGENEELTPDSLTEEQKQIFEKMVSDQLSSMKSNMDKMAKERDEERRERKRLAEQQRQAEIQAMEEAGKHEEAYKAKIEDLQSELEKYRSENTKLTRDQALDKALSDIEGKKFKNARARDSAFREIVDQLVQDENNNWVHRTGVSINDFVKTFAKSEEYEFYFELPEQRGAGTNPRTQTGDFDKKSLKEMSPEEAIEAAKKGKLGQKTY